MLLCRALNFFGPPVLQVEEVKVCHTLHEFAQVIKHNPVLQLQPVLDRHLQLVSVNTDVLFCKTPRASHREAQGANE
jgi:hypothetical protein